MTSHRQDTPGRLSKPHLPHALLTLIPPQNGAQRGTTKTSTHTQCSSAASCRRKGNCCSSPAMSKPHAPVSWARRAMSCEWLGGRLRKAHTMTFDQCGLSLTARCTASTAASSLRPFLRCTNVRMGTHTGAISGQCTWRVTHCVCRAGQNLTSEYTCTKHIVVGHRSPAPATVSGIVPHCDCGAFQEAQWLHRTSHQMSTIAPHPMLSTAKPATTNQTRASLPYDTPARTDSASRTRTETWPSWHVIGFERSVQASQVGMATRFQAWIRVQAQVMC